MAAPKPGSTVASPFGSIALPGPGSAPISMAHDGCSLYWTESNGGVWRMSIPSETQPTRLNDGAARRIAIDDTYVFFTLGTSIGRVRK
jgi:hypothetical protein